jgi:hypothetical protein
MQGVAEMWIRHWSLRAWLLSVMLHGLIFVTLAWLARVPQRTAFVELERPVGIVLASPASFDRTYFSEGSTDRPAAADARVAAWPSAEAGLSEIA